jgi:hypothetical protein
MPPTIGWLISSMRTTGFALLDQLRLVGAVFEQQASRPHIAVVRRPPGRARVLAGDRADPQLRVDARARFLAELGRVDVLGLQDLGEVADAARGFALLALFVLDEAVDHLLIEAEHAPGLLLERLLHLVLHDQDLHLPKVLFGVDRQAALLREVAHLFAHFLVRDDVLVDDQSRAVEHAPVAGRLGRRQRRTLHFLERGRDGEEEAGDHGEISAPILERGAARFKTPSSHSSALTGSRARSGTIRCTNPVRIGRSSRRRSANRPSSSKRSRNSI